MTRKKGDDPGGPDPAGDRQREARERQAATHAAQREVHTARRDTQREAQRSLRDTQRETQAARRDAQREVQVAGREKASAGRASALERAASKVERVAAKVDDALAAEAAKQERLAAKAEHHAAKLDRLAGYLGVLDVWTRSESGARRPRFSREEIAAAAVRIADEEGIEALSMRHLAAELGAGTMTLYHYVRTKDELMTLVNDAVMGEVVLPPGETLPTDWREALMLIADRSRAVMARHPWMFDVTDDPPIGPNSVRHFDQTLQAVASLDISLLDRLDITSCVDEYVFGYCLQQRNNADGDDGHFPDEMKEYVESLLATGGYPQLAALADEIGVDDSWSVIADHLRQPDRFRRNLVRILDGIEASLPPGAVKR